MSFQKKSKDSRKTIIIGIDGVSDNLVKDLAEKGEMPNLASLITNGSISKMHSAIPAVSNVNWSSIVTGKNPGEHGIFGFTELIKGTYTLSFPDRRRLTKTPFWKDKKNKKYVILNVPAMYPAEKINGTFVSGFVSPDLKKAVEPSEALDYLKGIDYNVDVASEKAHESKELFMNELFMTLRKREKAYKHFWKQKWDVFMVVFTGTDRLEHFFIDAHKNEDHDYHEKFIEYFKELDRIIGGLIDRIGPDDKLLMMSDHGMEEIKKSVNVNKVLEENGLLNLGNKPENRYKNIQKGTQAFSLTPGRIYLNRKERYPHGSIEKREKDDILNKIISVFDDLKYCGNKVIKEIHKKEEIYEGKQMDKAPDIVLIPESGFKLKGGVKYDELFEDEQILKGKHTGKDAFLYCNKDDLPKSPTVEDVRYLINES